jgi:hypothetical protein
MNDAVRTEPGALQFLKGRIEMESSTGAVEELEALSKERSLLPVPVRPSSNPSTVAVVNSI